MPSPLDDLIETASSDEVPVSTLLRKVKVVAARLGTAALEEWVDHELNGYPHDAELPDYRAKRGSEVRGDLGGPLGSGVKNAPIPPVLYPSELRHLFNVDFRQPIAELDRLGQATDQLASRWAADMIAYSNTLIRDGALQMYNGMYLHDAWHVISPANVRAIVDTVRTRILDLALSLEAIEPSAGERASPPVNLARIEQLVVNVFGGNVAFASSEVRQQAIVVPVGDRDRLLKALREAGVEDEAMAELSQAIEEDARTGEGAPGMGLGPRVKGWIADLAVQGPAAAGKGAAGAIGGLAVKAIAEYFGIA